MSVQTENAKARKKEGREKIPKNLLRSTRPAGDPIRLCRIHTETSIPSFAFSFFRAFAFSVPVPKAERPTRPLFACFPTGQSLTLPRSRVTIPGTGGR